MESGISCGTGGGGTLPQQLDIQGFAVDPQPAVAGGPAVDVIGQFQNIAAGDQCVLRLYQPGANTDLDNAAHQTIPLNPPPASGALSSLTFPSGSLAGQWNVKLSCSRTVSGQGIVLHNFPKLTSVLVNSSTVPTGCDNLPAGFTSAGVSEHSAPYSGAQSGGFGIEPGQGRQPWFSLGSQNSTASGALVVGVRSFRFEAPPGERASYKIESSNPAAVFSISSQCGRFDLPLNCLGIAGGPVKWTTVSSDPQGLCHLVPGQTYYVNYAYLNIGPYLNNGTVSSSCTGLCHGGVLIDPE